MQVPKIEERQDNIVEQLPYLNELMVAIRQINDAILQGKDPMDAAENLISDLPEEWQTEIDAKISAERKEYNILVKLNNAYLTPGHTVSQKEAAQHNIHMAGKRYARNIKHIVISLLNEKKLLFKTRKEIERGSLSLWKGGDIDDD